MKINPIQNQNLIKNYKTAKIPSQNGYVSQAGMDEVTFSQEALDFSRALSGAKDAFNVRSADEAQRVAEIAEQVKSGTYKINPEKIADKIIGDIISK